MSQKVYPGNYMDPDFMNDLEHFLARRGYERMRRSKELHGTTVQEISHQYERLLNFILLHLQLFIHFL